MAGASDPKSVTLQGPVTNFLGLGNLGIRGYAVCVCIPVVNSSLEDKI